ncbi:universal stress protein [Naumannella sp. ID2617S]|uniref:UspA domain-containing protein n=1 Tax=Enemella dayhoffiae TaxID=2016507 RepID=A0A255H8D1_9ACTN|nr:universal stress protein [Enemella dayhoffiae]NNG18186.1 universal stress protein [Naumannella sp. ID2617S]OYO23960.1 hypothetical protein CGZ93_05500 [Enemella dayhoffiae]
MREHTYLVVVGVSATSKSAQALQWATAQAASAGGRVLAVRAWRVHSPMATPSGPPSGLLENAAEVGDAAEQQLAADVAEVLGPDHGVEIVARRGGTFEVLLEASREADLLVVDAPRQLIAGPMFAHRLLYAADCPVVVMPPSITEQPESGLARFGRAVGAAALRAAGTAGRPGYRLPPKG